MMAKKLTDKQQRFVDEYLIDLNATQACIRAGYSPKTAMEQGHQLLQKTSVAEELQKQMAIRSRRTGVTQDRIIEELAKVAFLNVLDIIDEDGEIKYDAKPEDLSCIESIKVKTSDNQFGSTVEREIKVASKLKALELLGKHVGMWNDKLNVEITLPVIGGEDDLEE